MVRGAGGQGRKVWCGCRRIERGERRSGGERSDVGAGKNKEEWCSFFIVRCGVDRYDCLQRWAVHGSGL